MSTSKCNHARTHKAVVTKEENCTHSQILFLIKKIGLKQGPETKAKSKETRRTANQVESSTLRSHAVVNEMRHMSDQWNVPWLITRFVSVVTACLKVIIYLR